MKSIVQRGLIFFLLAVSVSAVEGFLASVPAADRVAAGIDKLTPAEQARLEVLVENYKHAAAPVRAAAVPETINPPAAAVVVAPGTKVTYADIVSTVAGEFEGWKPGQVLTLANGQRWRVIDEDSYYIRRSKNPAVEISPSKFGGYWMKFPALKAQVRVELVGTR